MRNSLYSVSLDEALNTIGGHGRYQIHMLIIISGIWMSQALFMMNLPYLLSNPNLNCNGPDCCQEDFELPEDTSNIVNEWKLFCGKEYKSTLISLAYFIGLGIGTYIISYLANRLGRKGITISGLILTSLTLFICAASPSAEFFMVFSLISGIFVGGTTMTSFIYIHEIVDGEYRNVFGGIIFAAWGFGMMAMCLINWAISQWRIHMVIIGFANIIWVPFLLRFYESPRFLASNQGKYSKARYIINCIAQYNQKQPFTDMLEGEKVIGYQDTSKHTPNSESTSSASKYSFVPISNGIVSVTESESIVVKRYSCCDLIRLNSLRKVFLVMSFLWFILSFSYYGVVFSIPHYIGNPQLNGTIMALSETISCIAMAFLLNKIGRQLGFVLNFGIAGVCCLMALAFINSSSKNSIIRSANHIIQLILLSLARFSIASVRLISYIYAVECFPTSVRSLVFGVLGLISLIGSLCCPLIIMLGSIISIHPLFFIGLLLIAGSFFSCLLTETLGKNMEDYVEEEKEEMRNPEPSQVVEMVSATSKTSNRKFTKLKEET